MSGKIKLLSLASLACVLAIMAIAPAVQGDTPRPTDILLKARFISGYLDGLAIPNKFLNDIEELHYLNGTSNFIVLRNDPAGGPYGGGFVVVDIVTGSRSGRYVNLYFDSEVVHHGSNLSGTCGIPYFVDPALICPVGTSRFLIRTGNEYTIGGVDPDGTIELVSQENLLNFATMEDGEEAYVHLARFQFNVPDSKLTRRNDSRDNYYFAHQPTELAKVKAFDWDGTKVNSWTISAISESYKVQKTGTNPPEYLVFPNGQIDIQLYSNAMLGCFHGIYNLPWKLEITRRP